MPPLSSMGVLLAVILGIYLLSVAIYVLREYERGVVFRLGRLIPTRGPGLVIIIPIIDRLVRVSLRIFTLTVPAQDVITKDNVSVKVDAVIYYKVVNPDKAIVAVEDFNLATSQISQTTLRSVLGQVQLDDLLAKRDELNALLQKIIDEHTEPWGIKVTAVEVKDVDLPQEMRRAIARQAEAERERRAKVIHAEGEYQASQRLSEAASIIGTQPMALPLRFLQTIVETASERTSTIIPIPIPLPMDWGALLSKFIKKAE